MTLKQAISKLQDYQLHFCLVPFSEVNMAEIEGISNVFINISCNTNIGKAMVCYHLIDPNPVGKTITICDRKWANHFTKYSDHPIDPTLIVVRP